jgi:hypothetical protein
MAIENGFGHHRNGDKKKSVSQIVATKTKIVTVEDFWSLQFLSFFDERIFLLPNNSHLINHGLSPSLI